MNKPKPNLAASARARLLNRAKAEGQSFDLMLQRFAVERLLYRLGQSAYADQFVLKGAQLLQLWFDAPGRSTRDLDLLGFGLNTAERTIGVFRDILSTPVEADGLEFEPQKTTAEPIRDDQEYHGFRAFVHCRLAGARLKVQIDIGFGDAIVPPAEEVDYPTLLDLPAPRLRAYQRETVIAEKLNAMVVLGQRNSRTKDFFDLWLLATSFDFDGEPLRQAIAATFARRQTALPTTTPLALTVEFGEDQEQLRRWAAFAERVVGDSAVPSFADIMAVLRRFLLPPLAAAATGEPFRRCWTAGGTWEGM